jgi:RNA-directed DNA polymerase
LGIASYEEKLVQLELNKIIEVVYEPRLLDCMYGARLGRGCHDAIKAINKAIEQGKTNWIIEADIYGYFDHVSHEWIIHNRVLKIKEIIKKKSMKNSGGTIIIRVLRTIRKCF